MDPLVSIGIAHVWLGIAWPTALPQVARLGFETARREK